ncbi:MAG: SH3 domain-containing protein [Lachnospiraceae bacterium]|nr:SH3 domain-containing protein [Lachnospiraceae bacterium]
MVKRKNAARILAIGLAAAMILGVLGVSFASFAATATVNGNDVRVRSTPSTDSSVRGVVNSGQTFEVGDPESGADGRQWYKVTLSDGSTGYIREDLLTITQDEQPQEVTETPPETVPDMETTPVAAPDTQEGTDGAAVPTTSSERYRIVNVPDDTGSEVWYVYDYTDGIRIKIEDLKQFDTYKESAESNSAKASRFRILMILFAILLVAAIVVATLLALRLRDVTSSDVDLAEARRKERKRNRNADDVSRLSGSSRNQTASRNRESAYPSGRAGRPGQNAAGGAQPHAAHGQQPARGAGQAARPVRGEDGRPVRGTGAQVQQRPVQPRPAQGQAAPQNREGAARPQQPRPVQGQAPAQAPSRPATQPRNFAVDEDMDYEFLNPGK